MTMNLQNNITLIKATKEDLPQFKKDLQASFSLAVIETFGSHFDEPIPSDEELEESFNESGAVIYHILSNGKKVGGAVVTIHEKTQHNALSLFFITADAHGKGIGTQAWKLIEEAYPQTKVWETHTPYFEKRNIHFYVNKCGFHIVEYFNKSHKDPHFHDKDHSLGDEDFFRFEKHMEYAQKS